MRDFIVIGFALLAACGDVSIGEQQWAALARPDASLLERCQPARPDLAAASDTGASDSDDVTNATEITITGTANAGRLVHVLANHVRIATVRADADGRWEKTLGTGAFLDGTVGFEVEEVLGFDENGERLGPLSESLGVTLDRTPPNAPGAPQLDPAYDTGAPGDGCTRSRTLAFAGTSAEDGAVELFSQNDRLDADSVRSFSITASVLGNYFADGALDPLGTGDAPDGTYAFTATITDVAGNVSLPSLPTLVTYRTSVAAPTLTVQEWSIGRPILQIAIGPQPDLDRVVVYAFDASGTAANVLRSPSREDPYRLGTSSLVPMGRADEQGLPPMIVLTDQLPDGAWYFTAIATDKAGNESETPLLELVPQEPALVATGTGHVGYVIATPVPIVCDSVETDVVHDAIVPTSAPDGWSGPFVRTITGRGCTGRALNADDARRYCFRQHAGFPMFSSFEVKPIPLPALPGTGYLTICVGYTAPTNRNP